MSPSDLLLLSAAEQLAALDRKEVSSRELVHLHLEHIARSIANAVVTTDPDRALAEADAADARRAQGDRGALLGLPMTVKDSLETAGMRSTCGARDLADHVPARDADAVARLRAAGAVIIGKTNVPTLCQDIQTSNPLFGTTPNPFDRMRTAGGSSGGSAAAVATHLTPLEVGSDLAGSLRLPAHYCGVFGLRTSGGIVPTRGHIPRLPGWLTGSDMLSLGCLARTAEDLALLLGVLAGPTPADNPAWRLELPHPRHPQLRDYRVAVWPDDPHCPVDTETAKLLADVASALKQAQVSVTERSGPVDMAVSDRLMQTLMYATSAAATDDASFAAEVATADHLAPDDHSPKALYLTSRTIRHRDWLQANEQRERLRTTWAEFFHDHDVLITPAAPTAAVPDMTDRPLPERHILVDGQRRNYWDQTTWANLVGPYRLPAAIVPLARTSTGLPLGVQIIGPYLDDNTVIDMAAHLARLFKAHSTVQNEPSLLEWRRKRLSGAGNHDE